MCFFDDPWSTTWMNIWHRVNWSTLMKSKSQSGFWYELEQPPIIWLDPGFYFRTDLTVITVYCVSQSWQRYFEEIRIPKICLWKLRKMWQIGNEVIRGCICNMKQLAVKTRFLQTPICWCQYFLLKIQHYGDKDKRVKCLIFLQTKYLRISEVLTAKMITDICQDKIWTQNWLFRHSEDNLWY